MYPQPMQPQQNQQMAQYRAAMNQPRPQPQPNMGGMGGGIPNGMSPGQMQSGQMRPMGGMPQGGPPTGGVPNYRGMGAPPNQPQNQMMPMQQRMPAPWMQRPPQSPQSPQSPQGGMPNTAAAGPSTSSGAPAIGGGAGGPAQPGAGGAPSGQMGGGRMPAPWMRPQQQGMGMNPAARRQSQGPQQPDGGGTSMRDPDRAGSTY